MKLYSSIYPFWLKKRISTGSNKNKVKQILIEKKLNTVCESARCPNINECFNKKSVTFMILGNICSRSCRFCAVKKSKPSSLDLTEPMRVAEAVYELDLSYVVITSVTRDDIEDGGAEYFVQTVKNIKQLKPDVKIELLIPDFKGDKDSMVSSPLKKIVESKPTVIGHNIETVPSLYPEIRPQAEYKRSVNLLRTIKNLDRNIYTKSGLMLGLGEKFEEVIQTMDDLRDVDCDILTLGQYLRPDRLSIQITRYITPQEFAEYENIAYKKGFISVSSGCFVRSSYNAEEIFEKIRFGPNDVAA